MQERASTVEWLISDTPVPYGEAVEAMEAHAAAIYEGRAGERVWLLEHPACYTAGTSAKPADLTAPDRFPVHRTGRGGQYTYHGPGQRIAYLMLDLRHRGRDVRRYVANLEGLLIDTLAAFNLTGERREGRVGVWISSATGEAKIAAIGVRVRRWVTLHGISLNVDPDLSHFSGIVPCGVREHGVTSLLAQGRVVDTPAVDLALRAAFEARFGPTVDAPRPAGPAPSLATSPPLIP